MPESHQVTRPYPGLRPFESWEGEIFFGRDEHTNRLFDILQQQRFLAVIGFSGSGKSSLVRAGLLPALPLGSLGTGSDWCIALLRPGNRSMQRLAHALLGRSALGIELVSEERIPQDERHLTADVALIEAELRRGPLGLIEVVKEARTRQTGEEPFNLLVLVDQFEEIFTYADAGGRQADESEAFVNLLLASRVASDTGIYIVLTMRTDFLGNCVRFLELPDAINRAQYLTPRLTREQIEIAISGPAQLFDGDVEPTLVAELINAVSNDPDQLHILQHALARMWESARRRTADSPRIIWDDFKAVGGSTDALSRHADEILASLSPKKEIEEPLSPEQRTAAVLFRAITGQRSAEAGGQAVRRPQSLDQIGKWSGRDWQEFLPVVRAFAQEDVNFLNYVGELAPETVVDISHEALIRQWGTLRDWVTDEAQLAAEYRRWRERAEAWTERTGAVLTGADLARAVEWRDGAAGKNKAFWKPNPPWASRYSKTSDQQPDRDFKSVIEFIDESARRRRIAFFSVATWPVMFIFIIAAFYMWQLWQTAEAEQNKAVALKLAAEGQLAENRHSNQLQLHALLAIESTKRYPSPLANQSIRHALDLMPRPLTTMLHQGAVSAVSFSPDGKTLASGSLDGTVRVWDLLATGKELQRLSHEAAVTAVSFSPDGKTLASGSRDTTLRVWRWQPKDLMDAACERSTRNLSWDEWRLYFEDLPYSKTCEHLPVHESVGDHAQQLAKAGDVAEATALFQRISNIEPSATLDPSGETDRWERKGKAEKILASAEELLAEEKYAELMGIASEAFQLDSTAVANANWDAVCWYGALDGQAAVVMRACDLAVERAGDDDRIHMFRDSRGLARALAGNTQGAIEDFEFFIEHTGNAERKSQRQAWVGALKAGKNPFTPDLLQSLRIR